MPRKRTKTTANYDKAFPSTLRELMKETGRTHSELAEFLTKTHKEISRQAVSYYCDGSSSPDWETLVAIAGFFEVTVDYLTGKNPDVKTDDETIVMVCDYTGLTEKTVKELHNSPISKLSYPQERLSNEQKSMLSTARILYKDAEEELVSKRELLNKTILSLENPEEIDTKSEWEIAAERIEKALLYLDEEEKEEGADKAKIAAMRDTFKRAAVLLQERKNAEEKKLKK